MRRTSSRTTWVEFNVTLLVLVAAFPMMCTSDCPEDITYGTSRCFEQYDTLLQATQDLYSNYFTGFDVESLRSLCHSLRTAVACGRHLKDNCPDTEHSDIEAILSDQSNMIDLCSITHLYETYARYQFCYQRVSMESTTCYETYLSDTESNRHEAMSGSTSALNKVCGSFYKLVGCIQKAVRHSCNEEAVELTEALVRPAIDLSEYCHNDTTTTRTTHKPHHQTVPPTKAWSVRQVDTSASNSNRVSINSILVVFTFLKTVYLIINSSR